MAVNKKLENKVKNLRRECSNLNQKLKTTETLALAKDERIERLIRENKDKDKTIEGLRKQLSKGEVKPSEAKTNIIDLAKVHLG